MSTSTKGRIEELERAVGSRDKTIAVLIKRIQDEAEATNSSVSIFQENVRLERIVGRRTRELLAQKAEMAETLNELQVAQAQLVAEIKQHKLLEVELRQAQKLEAVGRLASGIAHEINTPVQFVSDSLYFLYDAVADLMRVEDARRDALTQISDLHPEPKILAEMEETIEECDLEFLTAEMPAAITRALEGLTRVATIVRSMKEFAHPDQVEMTEVDLNSAINNTLTIARNEYKYVADVEMDLQELPLVRCHLGEVNQVFLNIIVNAAHAIDDVVRGTSERGVISVRSRLEDPDTVLVEIQDTGAGIPELVRDRVFDPFFTTKEVGKGTGQGLAISRSVIVEKHGGNLGFEVGAQGGTTFQIRLPVSGHRQASDDINVERMNITAQ